MRTFLEQTISGYIENLNFSDAEFRDCIFDNCCVTAGDPNQRPLLSNIELRGTAQGACYVHGARIEDVSVQGLKKLGRIPLFFWGAVFKHVKLSGPISAIKINRVLEPSPTKHQAAWDASCRAYYESVDWALDLREAEFQGGISLEAIPGKLVLRDPETQVLVTRERLLEVDWKPLVIEHPAVGVAIDWFLEGSLFDDVVLVAAKRAKYFKDELKVFEALRREGITN